MRRDLRQGPRRLLPEPAADPGRCRRHKSANGRRVVGLSAELINLLCAHRAEQDRERQLAAQFWEEGGWVFTSPTGQPVNPSTDYHEWKRLLRAAGVREARLHDACHTAATVLLVLGVPERAVMSLMG